jgi:hypothetical protein
MTRYVLLTAFLLAACGDGGGEIDVSVSYPATADVQDVAALRAWVVTGTEGYDASCNLLVAGAQEPYDVQLRLLGEGGARTDETLTATVKKGEGIVYVEAFDYAGEPLYAGCSPVAGSSVTVTLGLLRMYDCADPTTPTGARCDDGNICMIGEHCRSGQCSGGAPRNCSQFNGLCTAGICDLTVGCKQVTANEGQACDDGLFCTQPGTCTSGTCVAAPITCQPSPGPCLQNGICDEQLDRCIYLPKPTNAPCDDGNPCRTGDSCDNRGICQQGSTLASDGPIECDRNACTAGDSCSSGACVVGTTASGATSCDDGNPCSTNDTCGGTAGTSCVAGGNATATTPCWNTSYCDVDDRCSGFSSSCSNGMSDGDYDNDGYHRARGDGTSYSCNFTFSIDCDDNDPNTRPGAVERCGDLKDNDCDTAIDETGCIP